MASRIECIYGALGITIALVIIESLITISGMRKS
jgi:hypothetical protein